MAQAAPRWFPAPGAGDIVWCKFPQQGVPGPGPKQRPALVLRVGDHEGHPVVQVCYGASQKVDQLYAGEFAITLADNAAYAACGLSYSTKFDLRATHELDYNDVWFAVPPGAPQGQTPKLGLLHPGLMRRAAAAMAATKRR